jgi:putative DNA primase/helicase
VAYNYTDESGTLHFQVVRYDPKDFRQRRPDGNGGWIWKLNGVRRVLYQLCEVLGGEVGDYRRGREWRRDGTQNRLGSYVQCCGAGKWREEYCGSLRGKRVAIIVDADEPVRKHALQVAESLRGKVESLKVLELPGAKDLSEWVEQGGTRLSLFDLIRNPPEWDVAPASGIGNGSTKSPFRLTSCI